MLKLISKAKNKNHSCLHIFSAAVFFAFHHYFILYINSSYLETMIPRVWVGILYSIASILTILTLLNLSKIIKKIGILKTVIGITVIDLLVLAIIAESDSTPLLITCFIIYQSIPTLIVTCLDTSIEDTVESTAMGKTRGIFLTVLATASVLSPLVVGGMVTDTGFKGVYIFSFFFLALFLLIVVANRHKFGNTNITTIEGIDSVKEFWSIPDIRRIGIVNFSLHFFFSWMIIYIPLFLSSEMGFSWTDIGIMISITLLPFLILEVPAGELADNVLGEKEMLLGGMFFTLAASLLFPFLTKGAFLIWTLTILLGRIGASIMETMIESYFFKKSKGKDELIEVFRMSQPLAYMLGPVVGSIMLLLVPFSYIFPVLALVILGAMIPALRLKDTR